MRSAAIVSVQKADRPLTQRKDPPTVLNWRGANQFELVVTIAAGKADAPSDGCFTESLAQCLVLTARKLRGHLARFIVARIAVNEDRDLCVGAGSHHGAAADTGQLS